MAQDAAYPEPRIRIGIELSAAKWRLAFSHGGSRIRQITIAPGDEKDLRAKIATYVRREKLPAETPVVSCYEAGRDGFWVHRFLTSCGIQNIVVDAASIKVNRRFRRVKNDRVDATQLVLDLIRHDRGEKDVWSVVRVPTEQEEDDRRDHRSLQRLKKERTQHRARVLSLLATQGIPTPKSLGAYLKRLDEARTWNGQPLPPGLKEELQREKERLDTVERQMRGIEKAQEDALEDPSTPALQKVRRLAMLRGIGIDSAWVLVMEFFGWRDFKSRRQVGGAAGLGGTPYSSGGTEREQGISKSGNPRVRHRAVELAWQWLRLQPQSDLSQWFMRRFAEGGARRRRAGIVALSRRLLIALWHFIEHGVVPKGAVLKRIPVVIG
jgi:transposase